MFLIGSLLNNNWKYGMITMTIAMMIGLSSGTKAIKTVRPKKSSYLLLGIHQGTGIGVFLRMRKKK